MSSAILHIDGDAFFASVYQATHPSAKGKPVAIGRERGIATAISYEAKRYGITRGMLVSDIKKICPHCRIVTSDYRTYELFSRRMMNIAKKYSTEVERYSIDEAFVDITGYGKVHGSSYPEIALTIKNEVEMSLNLTVSVGLGATKSLAKIGSGLEKPSGLVIIDEFNREKIFSQVDIGKVWGIGRRLSAQMKAIGIHTVSDFIQEPQTIIEKYFNKSVIEIWHELHGRQIYTLSTSKKTSYKSISKTATVTPATTDPKILQSRLFKHIEKAFVKARRHNYIVGRMSIFLKTNKFTYHTTEIRLPEHMAFPFLIRRHIKKAFKLIYRRGVPYRASGVTIHDLQRTDIIQQTLFNENDAIEKRLQKIYPLLENKNIQFGSSLFDPHKREKRHKFNTLKLHYA